MSEDKSPRDNLTRARKDFRLSLVLLGVGLVYAVWPMDLIPDVAPLIGWTDDLGILALTALKSGLSYRRVSRLKKEDEEPGDEQGGGRQ